jgi:hypothetical protein
MRTIGLAVIASILAWDHSIQGFMQTSLRTLGRKQCWGSELVHAIPSSDHWPSLSPPYDVEHPGTIEQYIYSHCLAEEDTIDVPQV